MPQVIFFGMFFKKEENIYVQLYSLKERFNKTEIEMDSENESKLTSTLVEPGEIPAKKLKTYPCLFNKSQKMYKERDVVKNAWEAVASELHFIEDGMQSITQFIS